MMNVDDSVIDIIRQSALMYNVDKIILFGSRAKGNGNDRSDYDLLVFGGDYYGFCDYMDEDANTLDRFDISNGNNAGVDFLDEIMKYGVVIYEKAD